MARGNRIRNADGLVLDHHSGEIRTYIGTADYYDMEHGGMIDTIRIQRHAGSTLKPFLYALALDSGFTASSILPDLPHVFGAEEAYILRNYTDSYAGPVRLRTALAASLNIPAVHTVQQRTRTRRRPEFGAEHRIPDDRQDRKLAARRRGGRISQTISHTRDRLSASRRGTRSPHLADFRHALRSGR